MENLSKISKTFLYVSVISFAIFLGSYVVKLSLINQFFYAQNLSLKEIYQTDNLGLLLISYLPVISISTVTFILLYISFFFFLVFAKVSLKQNGWLFMVTLLLAITGLFETYLIVFVDFEVINEMMKSPINSELILLLFKQRLSELGPFPLILVFCYLAIIYLALFKPLQKKNEN